MANGIEIVHEGTPYGLWSRDWCYHSWNADLLRCAITGSRCRLVGAYTARETMNFSKLSDCERALIAEMGGESSMVKMRARYIHVGDVVLMYLPNKSANGKITQRPTFRRVNKIMRSIAKEFPPTSPPWSQRFITFNVGNTTLICKPNDSVHVLPIQRRKG